MNPKQIAKLIAESARAVLHAHGFVVTTSDGRTLTDEDIRTLTNEIGNNAAQVLISQEYID